MGFKKHSLFENFIQVFLWIHVFIYWKNIYKRNYFYKKLVDSPPPNIVLSHQWCMWVPVAPQSHQQFWLSFFFFFLTLISGRYIVASHCDYNLHFPSNEWFQHFFHVIIGHLHIFLFPFCSFFFTELIIF